jgi:hypothetical protein
MGSRFLRALVQASGFSRSSTPIARATSQLCTSRSLSGKLKPSLTDILPKGSLITWSNTPGALSAMSAALPRREQDLHLRRRWPPSRQGHAAPSSAPLRRVHQSRDVPTLATRRGGPLMRLNRLHALRESTGDLSPHVQYFRRYMFPFPVGPQLGTDDTEDVTINVRPSDDLTGSWWGQSRETICLISSRPP